MKTLMIGLAVFFCFVSQVYASDMVERYQYNTTERFVFDTASGRVYRFINDKGTLKHVEINFVTGIVKVDGAIRASGTFDYRDLKEEVIVSNV